MVTYPKDWKIVPLGECVKEKLSYGINAPAIPYNAKCPSYIRITDITDDGKYDDDDKKSVDTNQEEKYLVKEGDILLARTGASTGKSYLYHPKDGKLVYAGFLIKASIDCENHNPRFIAGQLKTKRFWKWVAATSMRSGQPGINGKEYASFRIPVTTKQEEEAIAATLSSFDNHIDNLTALIEKKKAIRDGALADLMSGRTRLAGFNGAWEEVKICDIADRFDNLRIPVAAEKRIKGNIPYYGANGIQDYVKGFTHDGEYILIAEDGANDLKKYPVQYVSGRIWVNNHAHVLQGKENAVDTKFLGFAMTCVDFESVLVGGTRIKLNAKTLMKMDINIPSSLAEQKAIADILTSMDTEIQSL